MKVKEVNISKLKELKEKAMMLNDERQKSKIKYKIWDTVVVVILAVLADCNERDEIEDFAKDERTFLKRFLKLIYGVPSAKTYERVISMIDSEELNKLFVEFINEIQFIDNVGFKDILSFDGKADERSTRKKKFITDYVYIKMFMITSTKINC